MQNREPSKIGPVGVAWKLWKLYGFSSPAELVLEDLALVLGVVVLEGRLDSADARLIRKGKKGLIRLKQDIPEPGRKRFAVAHELGHWLLHVGISQVLSCTRDDMRASYKGSPPEVEANYFAAELLMPQTLFAPRIRGKQPTAALLKELASYFLATLTATAVRYVELTDDECAFVISYENRIQWWRPSERYADHIWLDAGRELSPDTVAGAIFAGQDVSEKPEQVEASAWLGDRTKNGQKLIELAIPIRSYGQVLSVFWPA